MTTPAELDVALAAALARVERELAAVAQALKQIEVVLQFIASAAAAK